MSEDLRSVVIILENVKILLDKFLPVSVKGDEKKGKSASVEYQNIQRELKKLKAGKI